MIAIIPARGGSKGLPGKNVKLLGGRPLICHSISAALKAKTISRVIVSTDDDEIANVARECGAEVPFMRPKKLATDNSMVMDAYLYTIDRLANESKELIESFVALLPTTPLRSSEDIDNAVVIFLERDADSVLSVSKAAVPIEWYKKIGKDGLLSNYLLEVDAVNNRQDHIEAHIPNGAIYVFQTELLRKKRQYYLDKTYAYVMPRSRSADIDELLDFEWAEFLMYRKDA
jgi:CMP-N,N'-diacetyllegionaminic acid synthase